MEEPGRNNKKLYKHCKNALDVIVFVAILVIESGLTNAQQITLTRVSVRDDKNQPVISEIWQFLPIYPEKGIPVGETNKQGELELSLVCPQGTRIEARPHSLEYTYSKKAFCKTSLKLKVDSIKVSKQLQKNLDMALLSKNYAVATLIANELASFKNRTKSDISGQNAEMLAIVYAGLAFGVVDGGITFDPAQGKAVMTSKLQEKIRKYQRQIGIKETGRLDYKTVSTLAGVSSGTLRYYLYNANKLR